METTITVPSPPFRSRKDPRRSDKKFRASCRPGDGVKHCVCSRCGHEASAPEGRYHRHCPDKERKGVWNAA